MSQAKFVLHAKQFNYNFDKFMTKDSIKWLYAGLKKAGIQIMKDIITVAPRAPVLTSALVRSMSVFVNNKFIMSSREYLGSVREMAANISRGGLKANAPRKFGEVVDYSTTQLNDPLGKNEMRTTVLINAPYTILQHETYHKGFVSSKLSRFAYKYLEIVADTVRRRMNHA